LWAVLATVSISLLGFSAAVYADGDAPATKSRIRRFRLPAHYANIVTPEQREKIEKIHEEYDPKIEAAQAQLDAMRKELRDKISALLSDDQKKKLEEAEAAAKEKKVEKAAEKAAEKKPPSNPTTEPKKATDNPPTPDGTTNLKSDKPADK
jgi:Skp family chaperone for outer membrane proteins